MNLLQWSFCVTGHLFGSKTNRYYHSNAWEKIKSTRDVKQYSKHQKVHDISNIISWREQRVMHQAPVHYHQMLGYKSNRI